MLDHSYDHLPMIHAEGRVGKLKFQRGAAAEECSLLSVKQEFIWM